MKKIPTVFQRTEDRRHVIDQVTPGCEWVLSGEGEATRKYDGTCVLVRRDGLAVHGFARRIVKPGKVRPDGFVEMDHDPITGNTVGWEPIANSGFARWFDEAVTNYDGDRHGSLVPGTYELCGPKINGNPEGYPEHRLILHASAQPIQLPVPLNFGQVKRTMEDFTDFGWEGLVWHHPDGRMAKIKRKDFPA